MADQFWIQVRGDGTIIGKQRTTGKRAPINPPNRLIRVDEDFYQRCFMNPVDSRGPFVDGLDYVLDEKDIPDKKDDGVIDVARKINTRMKTYRT